MTTHPVLTYLSLVASTPVDGEQGWRAEAACPHTDPEAFFLDLGQRGGAGKKVCARCPVVQQRGQWAIATNELHGLWGGYLPRDRLSLRNTMRFWAQASGMECPATGGMPVEVQRAYLESHTVAAA